MVVCFTKSKGKERAGMGKGDHEFSFENIELRLPVPSKWRCTMLIHIPGS